MRATHARATAWDDVEVANRDLEPSPNGRSDGLNVGVKNVKWAGHGFARFDHYLHHLSHTHQIPSLLTPMTGAG